MNLSCITLNLLVLLFFFFFFSSRRRHTRLQGDWSSDVCSSDLVAIAALMIAVSVTIGVSLMIESFRSTVENWLDLSLRADIFVAAPTAGGTRAAPVLSADVPARVAAVPGVASLETFRSVKVASPLGELQLAVADPKRE